jgi:hypothetical protein
MYIGEGQVMRFVIFAIKEKLVVISRMVAT